ncbi:hypothetical protein N7447_009908 [Penicillium robsamsonii]|uniref:uncharacterized protein n=1 Tax=Penicillium robsamsonii TaxID=1792511 RepID=UPI0025469E9E|nr:uncharacterized protein N7447_009908 [Penicillium robsamsonii]KAJ5812885.1 hypothetical protein N7447_009908 [Penicillium robsamsonii]
MGFVLEDDDECVAKRVRPTLERAWEEASEMTRKRMDGDFNTPNSTQTEFSSIAGIWIVQGRARDRRMGSVEVERGLSILRSAEAMSAVAPPGLKRGQGSEK